MAYVIGDETAEPASKRARLESVIPVRSTAHLAPKPAQPAPPPPPKPVPPPLWLSGQLPANQRGNTNPRGQLRGGGATSRREEDSRDRYGRTRQGAGTGAAHGAAAWADGAAGEGSARQKSEN
jgi:hypothetical protein